MSRWLKHLSNQHQLAAYDLARLALTDHGIISPRQSSRDQDSHDESLTQADQADTGFESNSIQETLRTENGRKRKLTETVMETGKFSESHEFSNTNDLSITVSCPEESENSTTVKNLVQVKDDSKKTVSPLTCDKCGMTFIADKYLNRHIALHCSECSYVSTAASLLKRHMRTHTGAKPFKCPHCEFQASIKSSVTLHIRTHTGERPFPCDICDYAARTSSQLITHKLVHSGVKPYSCDRCGTKFKQAGSLGRHKRLDRCVDLDLGLGF
ncbi:hypothetical protein PoB_000356800 [Plakobranchus ocellatus]|uniref:C2H2-type domain-containing protein n=1 Tax=Plakobranchus ocellatus TaxID=259542 RepID=A0AAV3Y4E2_9GAST|nr:hypothetical protein PoB_000356800 [Plakobranchus ocellatus]